MPRQLWWIGTVVATAAGLALIFLRKSPALAALGVALLVLPHLVGAPQPASHESPIPEGLHHRFVVAVTITNLVFWALLGTLAGAAPAPGRSLARHPQGQPCLTTGGSPSSSAAPAPARAATPRP